MSHNLRLSETFRNVEISPKKLILLFAICIKTIILLCSSYRHELKDTDVCLDIDPSYPFSYYKNRNECFKILML